MSTEIGEVQDLECPQRKLLKKPKSLKNMYLKINTLWYPLYVESNKKWYKEAYLQNRNWLTDLKIKLVIAKGEPWKEVIN